MSVILFGVSPDFYFPMYRLLTKREVKMAGYWPSSVFARLCRFPDRDEIEVHKHAKETKTKFSHLDGTSLVNKGFIIWDN